MKKMYFAVVLLASLVIGACSSDDDNDAKIAAYTETVLSEAPTWQIDWSNNQDCPEWSVPDATLYGNWTTVMVGIEEALQPFVSNGDMMAFFVNDELRGLANPAVTLGESQKVNAKFLMKVYGNETGSETVRVSLKYYCKNLKHLFTLSDNISLEPDVTTGIDEEYIPPFTLGSPKFPVVKTVYVDAILIKADITSAQVGMVGAFVGEECRGLLNLPASDFPQMTIYGRSADESVTLKYYDATKGVLYTIPDAVKM